MRVPTDQIVLLRNILSRLQEGELFETRQLTTIYTLLFEPAAATGASIRPSLQASVDYLKELIEIEGMTTLLAIAEYFETERLSTNHFVVSMMMRVDWEQERLKRGFEHYFRQRSLDHVIWEKIQTHEQEKQLPLAMKARSAVDMVAYCTMYLAEFTADAERKNIFVWESKSNCKVRKEKVNGLFDLLSGTGNTRCVTTFNGCSGKTVMSSIEKYYQQTLTMASLAKPIDNIKIKRGIALLVLWSLNGKQADDGLFLEKKSDGDLWPTPPEDKGGPDYWAESAPFNVLMNTPWSILKCPDNASWLTSDTPGVVVTEKKEVKGRAGRKKHWGTMTVYEEMVKVYYPLSKHFCLRIIMSEQRIPDKPSPTISFKSSSKKEWLKVNRITCSSGKKMIFSCDEKTLLPFSTKK